MSANFKQLPQFTKQIEKLTDTQLEEFLESCSKELAARLIAKVVKRTPVSQHKGGTLRRGWTGERNENATKYAQSLPVEHVGNKYVIEITNPVEYASYVEYGHRTVDHKGWVRGRFMLTISEAEIRNSTQGILQAKLNKFMKGLVKT